MSLGFKGLNGGGNLYIPYHPKLAFPKVFCLFAYFWHDSPPRGPGPPHSRGFWITHNDASQSVGLLSTSDQSVAETSTWQHKILTTDKHPCPRWDSNPQSQQASGRRPTPYTARPLGPAVVPVNTQNIPRYYMDMSQLLVLIIFREFHYANELCGIKAYRPRSSLTMTDISSRFMSE